MVRKCIYCSLKACVYEISSILMKDIITLNFVSHIDKNDLDKLLQAICTELETF